MSDHEQPRALTSEEKRELRRYAWRQVPLLAVKVLLINVILVLTAVAFPFLWSSWWLYVLGALFGWVFVWGEAGAVDDHPIVYRDGRPLGTPLRAVALCVFHALVIFAIGAFVMA